MIEPIYHDLSGKLENYIRERKLTGRLPGVGRLSKEFQVNPATMNKAVRLLEEKGVVEVLGTRGTFVKASESRRHYRVIGLIGMDDDSAYESRILGQLNGTVGESGYRLLGIRSQPELFRQEPELLLRFPVDGFVFAFSSLTHSMAEFLLAHQVPLVCCNARHDLPGVSTFDFDSVALHRQILDRLMKLGHRRIAFVEYKRRPEYQYHLNTLENVYREKLQENYQQECFLALGYIKDYYQKYGERYDWYYAREVLRHFSRLPEFPTAIISHEYIIQALKEQLEDLGMKVPEDISLFSLVCNIENHEPEFDAVFFEYDKLFLLAVQHLIKRIENAQMPLIQLQSVQAEYLEGFSIGTVRKQPAVMNIAIRSK